MGILGRSFRTLFSSWNACEGRRVTDDVARGAVVLGFAIATVAGAAPVHCESAAAEPGSIGDSLPGVSLVAVVSGGQRIVLDRGGEFVVLRDGVAAQAMPGVTLRKLGEDRFALEIESDGEAAEERRWLLAERSEDGKYRFVEVRRNPAGEELAPSAAQASLAPAVRARASGDRPVEDFAGGGGDEQ
jgi:hypothetical protein